MALPDIIQKNRINNIPIIRLCTKNKVAEVKKWQVAVSLRMLIIHCVCSFSARPSSHYKRESIPGLRTTREKMERFFDYLLLVCYLFQLSLSTRIEIPPTIVYGQPGQCAANVTTDSESDRILIRERVIPSLSQQILTHYTVPYYRFSCTV